MATRVEIAEAIRLYMAEPKRRFRWMPVSCSVEAVELGSEFEGADLTEVIAPCRIVTSCGCFKAVFAISAKVGSQLTLDEVFEVTSAPKLDQMLRGLNFIGPEAKVVREGLGSGGDDFFMKPAQLDQTNSAFFVGKAGFGKFYRACSSNSREARMYRMLEGSTAVSHYWGSFSDETGSVSAVVVDRIEDASSAFDVALQMLSGQDLEAEAAVTELIHETGALLGRLHDDLEAAQNRDKATTPDDVAKWLAARLELALLAPGVRPTRDASLLQDWATELSRLVDQLWGRWSSFEIHGDFHLGQVLKSGAGMVVIDFEGEPISDAGAMDLPQRDLAGLLRSVGYVTALAAQQHTEVQSQSLVQRLRAAALEGYASSRVGERVLAEPASVALLGCFEVEKAIYEYVYEQRFRPQMMFVPESFLFRVNDRIRELAARCVLSADQSGDRSLRALISAEYAL